MPSHTYRMIPIQRRRKVQAHACPHCRKPWAKWAGQLGPAHWVVGCRHCEWRVVLDQKRVPLELTGTVPAQGGRPMSTTPVKPEDENGANHPEQQRAPQVGPGGAELTEQQSEVSEVPVADAPKDK